MNRWWIYQRERFPLAAHGPVVLAFSFCAVSYSRLLRGGDGPPGLAEAAVAFVTALLFFLQLRIADEFKDFEEDSRFRPYRAVPRGLVTRRELGLVGVGAAAVQAGLALWLTPSLLLVLLLPWIYFALMSKEFFVRRWLVGRPFTYLWTHMLVMPLIDLYATSCDWHVAGARAPKALIWFLAASYFNGMVIEIGRKIRAPGDEEEGVVTYTTAWGIPRAVGAWLAAMGGAAALALVAAQRIGFAGEMSAVLCVLLVMGAVLGLRFVRRPSGRGGKMIEVFSGLWTLLVYVSLGVAPLVLRWIG